MDRDRGEDFARTSKQTLVIPRNPLSNPFLSYSKSRIGKGSEEDDIESHPKRSLLSGPLG